MRDYLLKEDAAEWTDNKRWEMAVEVGDAIAAVYREMYECGEKSAARELDSNWWTGSAYCHGDLSAEEIASMLLDGFDIGDQP